MPNNFGVAPHIRNFIYYYITYKIELNSPPQQIIIIIVEFMYFIYVNLLSNHHIINACVDYNTNTVYGLKLSQLNKFNCVLITTVQI